MHVLPEDIERTSFGIISNELEEKGIVLDDRTKNVVKRCIHTSADFEYADSLRFSNGAIDIAKKLIRNGAHIVTDTNMALAGINKGELAKYGCKIDCYMAEPEIIKIAKECGKTRASVSMEHAAGLGDNTIFVIGNAPTALVSLCDLMDDEGYKPGLIIGVPVGFVNVENAKDMVMEREVPYIVNKGRKGGSNIAACIVNAILYEMREENG
ncbi:MAG: precorrin-8X methylmutase [Lachnospiraceae bacterium]|nr:precorrin-8X methylmutase [Lachnospiraceae bacterium]